jgi:hypothetical protein
MALRLVRDLERLSCPHCPAGLGLELALRLELEAESAHYFASCPACNRLYEVMPGGAGRPAAGERPGLAWRRGSWPRSPGGG